MTAPPLGVEQGNLWSTQEQEDTILDWVNGQAGTVTTLATSREGRPIRMATFGDMGDPTLLLVGGQHGNEPSSREVLLWFARELAQGNGPAALLQGRSVAVLPNANPDGREHNLRDNTEGVNPNRDIIALAEAEAQAIHAAMTATDPVLIVDLHEYGGEDGAAVWAQPHTRADTHASIAQHGRAATDAALAAAAAAGNPSAEYPLAYRLTLNSVAPTLMHRTCVLVEVTWRNHTRPQRFQLQQAPLAALVDYFIDNTAALSAARDDSRVSAQSRPGPDLLYVWADQATPTNGHVVDLEGYDLTEPIPAKYLDAHGVQVEGGFVSMQQEARGLLPELLDPILDSPVAAATRRLRDSEQSTHGLAVPFSVDAVATSGLAEVWTEGNAPATARVRIEGPCQCPEVSHLESGSTVVFDLILDTGEWLDVDLDARTVMLNGQASRRGRMRGNWFDLVPGRNTVAFNALDSSTDAQLIVHWRDAYR